MHGGAKKIKRVSYQAGVAGLVIVSILNKRENKNWYWKNEKNDTCTSNRCSDELKINKNECGQ